MECKQKGGNPEKGPKGNAGIKKTVTESENAFNGLIKRLGMAEERISELKDVSRYFSN